jgi:hypothetical protein
MRAGEEIYLKYKHPFTKAVAITTLENLNKTIMEHLKRPDLLKRERYEMAVENGGIDKEDPVKNIINIIERYEKI